MKATLDCINWPGEFPDKPFVEFEILNEASLLRVRFKVREDLTAAAAEKDFDEVWNDSCVELFIQFEGDEKYYNIETSCNGRQLMGWRSGRTDSEDAPQSVLDSIKKTTSLEMGRTFGEMHIDEWTLELEIPASAFWRSGLKSFEGVRAVGNVYKCNSGMRRQHYVTWAPISTPAPDYHRPEFFRALDF